MTFRLAALMIGCLGIFSSANIRGQVPLSEGEWPQWRGPNRDGISLDRNLLKEWPAEGPKVLWQVDTVGVGYSSIAVKDGRIFTQGDLNGVEHVIALDAKDGRTVWSVQPGSTAEQLDTRIKNDLKQIDKNGDGTISEVEALARFGWDWNKYDAPSAEPAEVVVRRRTESLFKELDKNADGKLLFDEVGNLLRDMYERIDAADPAADVAALAGQRTAAYLKELDKNGDGQISKQEARGSILDRLFNRIDSRDPATNKGDDQLTAAEIDAALQKIQPGRDGAISKDELQKFYTQEKVTGDGVLTEAELHAA